MSSLFSSSTVIDSILFRDAFGTQAMRDVFSDRTLISRYIEVEVDAAGGKRRVLLPMNLARVSRRHVKARSILGAHFADVPGLRGGQLTLALNAKGGQVDLQTSAGSALWLPGLIEPAEVPLQQLQARLRWAVRRWRLMSRRRVARAAAPHARPPAGRARGATGWQPANPLSKSALR